MKNKSFFVLLGIFLSIAMSGCSASSGLSKDEKIAKEAALREAIEKRMFVVEVDRVNPMSGSSRMLTSLYSLEVNEKIVKSYLPYFGRAYSVPYGGGEGLIFDAAITDYQLSTEKKGNMLIEFKTKSKEDFLVYRIHITRSGDASIDITSANRQPISYRGRAYPKK